MFLSLGEVAYVGDSLCSPGAYTPLVTRDLCSGGAPYMSSVDPPVVSVPAIVGSLVGMAGCSPGWLSGLALCHD